MQKRWENATLEWLWDSGTFRCDLPNGDGFKRNGSYEEVVKILNELGEQGWEVAACVSNANWLFWTLKREILAR